MVEINFLGDRRGQADCVAFSTEQTKTSSFRAYYLFTLDNQLIVPISVGTIDLQKARPRDPCSNDHSISISMSSLTYVDVPRDPSRSW